MSVFGVRGFMVVGILALCPVTLFAEGTNSAIIHSKGGVRVNGSEVADASTVFAGDSIETKTGFVADLDSEGSSVLIQGESIVKFEGDHLVLEHGSVDVGTSTLMSVYVNCIRVEPISKDRTQYDVTYLTNKVEVAARKKDVRVKGGVQSVKSGDDSPQSATVHEGEQTSRDDSVICGVAPRPVGAGSGLNTKWLEIGGGGGGGALILCLLLCKGSPPSSMSPSQP